MNHSLVALLKFRMSNFICRSCSKLLIFLNHYHGKSSAGWLAGSKTEFKSPPPQKKSLNLLNYRGGGVSSDQIFRKIGIYEGVDFPGFRVKMCQDHF